MPDALNWLPPRDELLMTIERIYRYQMTTTSGGNLSLKDADGNVWITPSRVDKGALKREDMVCIRPDGSQLGLHPPSSEWPFHKAIYDSRPDLRGIVHAHPVSLVAFSIAGKTPNTMLFHVAREVCGDTAFAAYALPGSQQLGVNIAECFAQGHNSVILENHGTVVGGTSLQEAFQRFETLEFTAKTIIKAGQLSGPRFLTPSQFALSQTEIPPLRAAQPVEPTTEEKELRADLCRFIRRGYEHRLFISTVGSFSARLGSGDAFLITPSRADRYLMSPDDLVLVTDGCSEPGKMASRAARNHRAIYQRHPKIKSIVNAFAVNASAFAVSDTRLDTRTIPESYLFLRDVQRLPFGMQFSAPDQLASAISPDQPAMLQENDGVIVVGRSVLDAFDRLEVLESTAEAVINSYPLGAVRAMPDNVIDELNAAFPML